MKGKLSIKARVTAWYTFFLLLLIVLTSVSLLFLSSRISSGKIRQQLHDVVTEAVANVRFRHNDLDTDRMDFYKNGVSVFVYNTQGYLIAPKTNLGIQVDAILEDQTVKTVYSAGERWMIYDVYAVADNTGFWVRGLASVTESGQTYSTLSLLLLILFPILAVIAGLGGYRITRKAFRPVKQIAETAGAINSGTDLSQRISYNEKSRDELSALCETMNQMLARLQNSFEAERQFTSDVSHELRTPLSVIHSQCQYALSPESSPEERIEALQSINRQTNYLTSITSQLLLLSRADQGRFEPDFARLDFAGLCRNICEDLEPVSEAAGLSMNLSLPGQAVFVNGDSDLLTRMITNLISNAVRYNKPEGNISVSLAMEDDFIRLTVSDTGIGIKEEDLPKIFRRFYRTDSTRSTKGSGLGLAMVEWIASVHGGRVTAESTYGIGSRFSVWLPAA